MRYPLVTLDRAVWRLIVEDATRDPARERYGYLVGRETRVGARVHAAVPEPEVTSTDGRVDLADEDEAKASARIIREYGPLGLERVGSWHTHIYAEACVTALLPLLSDTDEMSTPLGAVEMIVAVVPLPDSAEVCAILRRPSDMSLRRTTGTHLCRGEVWLRQRIGKVLPCRLRLR